ncbi:unnamed protein product [Clavelina lepadiformis]|uniref:Ints3-like C-terminal domain-containing protein n=1 Tax=Clavelina lepadiformis TaxID=159417 RepID=A0ABP0FPJ3_CLALP
MLSHVDNLRKASLPKSCNLFSQDSIVACLFHVQQHCDETCKSRFSDLFAIAEDSDDEVLMKYTRKRSKTSGRHGSTTQARSKLHGGKHDSEDSASDSSSDEDDFKKKRKRKARANDSSESD